LELFYAVELLFGRKAIQRNNFHGLYLAQSVRSAPGYRSECFRFSICSFVKCLDRTKVQQQAEITEVPELKAFAEETLPKLRNHLQMAKALKAGRALDQLDG